MTAKTCGGCGAELPATTEFFYKSARGKFGLQSLCIPCHLASDRRRYGGLTDEQRLRRGRQNNLRHRYGIDVRFWSQMFSEQGGVCAICQTDSPGGQNNTLHVDHSHSTGDVRGLLCVNCNKGLGHFQDSIELLAAASDYLSLFILKAIK